MGGFTFNGPNYTFESVIEYEDDACFDVQVYCDIDLQTEQFLLNNPSRQISDKELYKITAGQEGDVGDGRKYTVYLKSK